MWHESQRPTAAAATLEDQINRAKIDFIRPFLPAGGRAVEIGCGSGRLLAGIGQAAPLGLVAVDSSPAALALARETLAAAGSHATFVSADARDLPFTDRSFDVVLSGGLLEHFPDPGEVLAQMVRILRPGALLYLDIVPRKFSLFRLREAGRMLRGRELMPGVSESAYGPAHYIERLRLLGCTVVRCEWCGVYPPWRAHRAFKRTRWLDNTAVARWLGWYFMVLARRSL
jgi:ubiquinone/menaquinone biosynthesis C-methylase UbiE